MSENIHMSKQFLESQLGQTMPKSEKSVGPYLARAKNKTRRGIQVTIWLWLFDKKNC